MTLGGLLSRAVNKHPPKEEGRQKAISNLPAAISADKEESATPKKGAAAREAAPVEAKSRSTSPYAKHAGARRRSSAESSSSSCADLRRGSAAAKEGGLKSKPASERKKSPEPPRSLSPKSRGALMEGSRSSKISLGSDLRMEVATLKRQLEAAEEEVLELREARSKQIPGEYKEERKRLLSELERLRVDVADLKKRNTRLERINALRAEELADVQALLDNKEAQDEAEGGGAKVKRVSSLPGPEFEPGAHVVWRHHGSDEWHPGKVLHAKSCSGPSHSQKYAYDIICNNGEVESKVSQDHVRMRHTNLPRKNAVKEYAVGDPVFTRSSGEGEWQAAGVATCHANGTYNLTLADGSVLEKVHFLHIKCIDDDHSETEQAHRTKPTTKKEKVTQRSEALSTGYEKSGRKSDADRERTTSEVHRNMTLIQSKVRQKLATKLVDERRKAQHLFHQGQKKAAEEQHQLRQKKFVQGEKILARVGTTEEWAEADVMEVCGGGLYNIEFGDGEVQKETSFLLMRHLGTGRALSEQALHETLKREESKLRNYNAGDLVFVLKRGKKKAEAGKDPASWRLGTILNVKGNGMCKIEYQAEGSPVENNVSMDRLKSGAAARQKKFHEGEMCLVTGEKGGFVLSTVVRALGDGEYSIIRGNETEERVVHFTKMAHLSTEDKKAQIALRREKLAKETKVVAKQKKLKEGQIVAVKRDGAWTVASVVDRLGEGKYQVTFADGETAVTPFTKMRLLEVGTAEEGEEEEEEENKEEREAEASKAKKLRQKKFSCNDPVLVLGENKNWSVGWITRVVGEGKYDICSIAGNVLEGVSFLAMRHLDNPPEEGTEEEITEEPQSDAGADAGADGIKVGSEVLVLPDDADDEARYAVVKRIDLEEDGDAFYAVKYTQDGTVEEYIEKNRIKTKKKVRQKKFRLGEWCLAKKKMDQTSGWYMAVITKIDKEEKCYEVQFCDDDSKASLSFFNIRHMDAGREEKTDPQQKKTVIRAKALKPGELVLGRVTEGAVTQWLAGKVTEALGEGQYMVLFINCSTEKKVHFSLLRALKVDQEPEKKTKQRNGIHIKNISVELGMSSRMSRKLSPQVVLSTGEAGMAGLEELAVGSRRTVKTDVYPGEKKIRIKECPWLSLEGLQSPELLVTLVSNDEIVGEACLDLAGSKECAVAEYDIGDAFGSVVSLSWRKHHTIPEKTPKEDESVASDVTFPGL
ncbi:unnamed protein product [Chrysoparadoxa australica]